MSKRKNRSIKILNAHGPDGISFTSRARALKYLKQGRARYVDEGTIEMVPEDWRHQLADPERQQSDADPAPVNSPVVDIARYDREAVFVDDVHQTFLSYPQKDQTSTRSRLKRAA